MKGLSYVPSLTALDHESDEMEYGKKMVRQDRKPLDFTRMRSKILDNWFEDKFGIRARSQCMFVTGQATELGDLKFYGTPCVVFPIGKFEYVWSRYVQDLYGDLNIGAADDGKAYTDEELERKMINWLKDKHYQKTGLDQAVKMKNEVMIKCESYYAFPIEYLDDLKKALGFS